MGVYKQSKKGKQGNSWIIDFKYQGQRYRECVGPISKSAAKEILLKRKAEIREGRYDLNRVKVTPLFETFMDEYLETFSKQNKKPKSYQRDITSSKHLKAYFDGKRLANITTWQIEKYKAMRKAEVAEASVNRELACLRHMLNMAVKWGKLKVSPFKGIKLFKENNGRMRILSPEEEEVLFEVIGANPKASHLEAIVTTGLNTGLRLRNILTLKKDQVNFKEGYILVERTKSGEDIRIPMNDQLTKTLKGVTKDRESDSYVFTKNDGTPFGSIRTAFEKAVKKAGLKGFRFHDLRHTFATRLVMAGVDLVTVKELLGHKTIKMTMRYSHPTPEHKKAAVKILDRVTRKVTISQEKKVLEFPGKA